MNENEARNNAGRLGFDIKGFYDNTVTYDFLDVVYYNNSSYVAKKLTVGNEPNENNEYWQILARGLADAVTGVKGEKETEYRSGKVNITAEDVGALPIDGGEMQGNLDIGKNIIKAGEGFNVGAFTSGHDFNIYNDDGTGISLTGTSLIPRHQGDNVEKLGSQSYPWGEVWAKNAMHASDFVAGEGGKSGRSLANLTLTDLSTNNYIDMLTSINQITSIGFWKIENIDNDYAQSIGIRAVDNTGDFYAIVSNYNGDGVNHFVYGNLMLFSPRLGTNYYTVQVWDGVARGECMITHSNLLNTTEQISANTESFYAAGALAVKAMMADYNAKINQINSNMAYKMPTGGYYGGDTGLNDIKNVGFSRKWISTASDDGKYLGFGGSCLIINSMSAGYLFQIIFSVDGTGGLAWRRNMVQNDYTFSYDTPLFRAQLMN